ncbi:hypothetical protein [Encephalitozoon cuniculi GB-M1]|uniref:Uncharacterized protein n=1 Tax=Encephalitozoon cuniculi (strain GB-M1) TaxID=284813 RepID=Q8SV21_ENCCU|nr:uncharacterized protein ECU07_0580 [Encephalitozoon cuniculi GB-M1]CAD25590.2 hypothetical protein [Encephalitozoon cuniculi GB-M1]
MKEAAEFLRNVPMDKRPCVYTRAQATALYEEHRKQILKKLVVREVQKRVTNKILGKENSETDLLFLKRRYNTSMSGISDMLTDDECLDPVCGVEDLDRSEVQDPQSSCSQASGPDIDSSEAKPGRHRLKRAERFVDLEASMSGDESESPYEEEDDLGDLSFVASSDEDYEPSARKHNYDMLKINRSMLKRLKKRFSKKSRCKVFFGPKNYTEKVSDDEEEKDEKADLLEDTIEDIAGDFVFPKEEMEYPAEARCLLAKTDQIEFVEDVRLAEKRLGEGRREWDFDNSGDK